MLWVMIATLLFSKLHHQNVCKSYKKKIKIKDKKLPDLVLADYRLILLFLLASFEMLGTLGFLAKLLHSQLVYHRLFLPRFLGKFVDN